MNTTIQTTDSTNPARGLLQTAAKVFATDNDWALTLARLTLGAVFFAHGAQKMLGWFGGYGFNGTMGFFTQQMGIPAVFAFLAIAAEFFGGLGLIVGLLGRIAAFGILSNMAVAIVTVHAQFGFFANWMGNQKGEGIEYHLLAIALALVIIIKGSGAASLDWLLARKANVNAK
ncbi:MAG TPA: DoxX family protein [Planctomycetota bacterium]|nr:DoxX family protein [Planctomycetota bacterium]